MRKASDIISALFKDRFGPGFMETARQNAELFSSWKKIVIAIWPAGFRQSQDDIPAIAAHSQIRELQRGLLLVEADHPGWVQILQTKQKELLAEAQARYPELDIRSRAFRLSREPFPEAPAPKPAQSEPSAAPLINAINLNESPVPKDEELSAVFSSLEKSVRERNKRLK
jgi:hypothetical protein